MTLEAASVTWNTANYAIHYWLDVTILRIYRLIFVKADNSKVSDKYEMYTSTVSSYNGIDAIKFNARRV